MSEGKEHLQILIGYRVTVDCLTNQVFTFTLWEAFWKETASHWHLPSNKLETPWHRGRRSATASSHTRKTQVVVIML